MISVFKIYMNFWILYVCLTDVQIFKLFCIYALYVYKQLSNLPVHRIMWNLIWYYIVFCWALWSQNWSPKSVADNKNTYLMVYTRNLLFMCCIGFCWYRCYCLSVALYVTNFTAYYLQGDINWGHQKDHYKLYGCVNIMPWVVCVTDWN